MSKRHGGALSGLTVMLLAACGSGRALPVDAAGALPVGDDARPGIDGEDPAGEPTGIIPGQALGKFCHELNRSGLPLDLTLEFGAPAVVRISARTGVCAPPAGMPCLAIPIGLVPLRLLEGDKILFTRSVVLSDGREYVFQPVITNNLQVALTGGQLGSGVCQDLDFPGPDGGPGDASVPGDTAAGE
jgi:hypothetical protein